MAPRQRLVRQRSSEEVDVAKSVQDSATTTAATTSSTKSVPPNYTEADIARDRHDYFNLIALLFIVGTIYPNYDFTKLYALKISYIGNHFWLNWATTVTYFAADLLWVAIVPICVKSPSLIIKHHSVTILYLLAPVFFPDYRWLVGALLSVEVNTWFLILRRVVYKQGGNDKEKKISPIITETVSILFYVTWIFIRCIVYPGIMLIFLQMAKERIEETGTWRHRPIVFIPVHFCLCCLNIKWTYDLFKPLVKRWLGMGPKSTVIQTGL